MILVVVVLFNAPALCRLKYNIFMRSLNVFFYLFIKSEEALLIDIRTKRTFSYTQKKSRIRDFCRTDRPFPLIYKNKDLDSGVSELVSVK